jgi:hypothetical protein
MTLIDDFKIYRRDSFSMSDKLIFFGFPSQDFFRLCSGQRAGRLSFLFFFFLFSALAGS